MQKIELPKLKLTTERPKRLKIFLLSDDLRMHSGIATMSREFVVQTADIFDWVQLGAALEHPDHGKVFDVSADVNREKGISDSSVKVYAHSGYGHPDVVREIIALEHPDAILHFTDPRFWEWLYSIEHEIRSVYKLPIMYYNIWDDTPAPFWNKPFYTSCDLIMNISKQTHNLVKMVVGDGNYMDLDTQDGDGDILVSYVPHGIDGNKFYPITSDMDEYIDYNNFAKKFKESHDVDFIIFWNNRNIRRKQPGDVILSFKKFCELLPVDKRSKVALFMHTNMVDPNGTDLPEVVRTICPEYKVIFNEERLPTNILNYFYNLADVTLNISSNEGFGIATAESVIAGTPIVINVTGGLQDQVRFTDDDGKWIDFTPEISSNHTGIYKNHGEWAKVVYPSNRSLQGSVTTPYIFDDRCDYNTVASALYQWWETDQTERDRCGIAGRNWMLSPECGMSAVEMGKRMAHCINKCISEFKPKDRYHIFTACDRDKITNAGAII